MGYLDYSYRQDWRTTMLVTIEAPTEEKTSNQWGNAVARKIAFVSRSTLPELRRGYSSSVCHLHPQIDETTTSYRD